MRGWFKRRPRPAEQPPKPDGWDDRHYAAAYGYTLPQWVALPTETKRELRNGVAHAPNMTGAARGQQARDTIRKIA